jgi:polyisoprenoid-binding protein YceI
MLARHGWAALTAVAMIGAGGGVPDPTNHAMAGGPPDSLLVNPRASVIHWKGAKLGAIGPCEGTVRLTRGEIVLHHSQLTSATFTVDMRSLDVTASPASAHADERKLRPRQLASAWFEVMRYPTTSFVATKGTRTGDGRYSVAGNLTLHGVTRPATLTADVQWKEVGHALATSTFSIDSRQWGIGASKSGDGGGSEVQLSVSLDVWRRGTAVAAGTGLRSPPIGATMYR